MTLRVRDWDGHQIPDLQDRGRGLGSDGGLRAAGYRSVSPWLAITPSVSVVIPAKNEARNLPYVLATLPSWVDEIVLVDGHSVDGTAEVARQLNPEIKVVSQRGEGKGDALLAGFQACTGDIIVTIDADGSTDGTEIVPFVAALVAGADFAKGSRFAAGGGSDDITLVRRWGNRVLISLVNLVFGTRYTDLCYGYNAFWARHVEDLALDCTGFEVETLMNVRAAKAGLRVQEVPSIEHPRMEGVSNLRALSDGWRILKVIMREWQAGRSAIPRRALSPRAAVQPVIQPVAGLVADTDQEGQQ